MKIIFTLITILLSATISANAQQSFFGAVGGGYLYSIHIDECTTNLVGTNQANYDDIALTPDLKLWGIAGGNLFSVDTSNANSTYLCRPQYGYNDLEALNDSTLLMVGTDSSLYGINTSNCAEYLIGYVGYAPAGDLTWYDDNLYMTTQDGFLIKIVLNNTNSQVISSTRVNAISDSTFIRSYGLSTASFADSANALVAFIGKDAYKICPIDGSYYKLCSSLIPIGGFLGTAASRLPKQDPSPTSCTVGIFNISYQLNVIVSPVPVLRNGYLHIELGDRFLKTSTLKIFGIDGTQIYSSLIHPDGYEFNFDLKRISISSGVYLLNVSNSDVEFHKLFVVE